MKMSAEQRTALKLKQKGLRNSRAGSGSGSGPTASRTDSSTSVGRWDPISFYVHACCTHGVATVLLFGGLGHGGYFPGSLFWSRVALMVQQGGQRRVVCLSGCHKAQAKLECWGMGNDSMVVVLRGDCRGYRGPWRSGFPGLNPCADGEPGPV